MSSSERKPYLSLVVPSRNDEHGGNMLQCMQVSLGGLFEQLEKHRVESELILVEWNPPTDRPLLKDIFNWPSRLRYCTIRAVVVPPSIHLRYKGHDKLPVHKTASANVGIRRSRGQFILLRPIDLIYSDDLVAFIAQKRLSKDQIYRTNRCDIDRNVVQYNTLKKQLEFCRQNIIKIHSRDTPSAKSELPNLHTNACGDFQLLSRERWYLLHGHPEIDLVSAFSDGILSYMAYAAGVKETVLNEPMSIYHIDHDSKFTDGIKRAKLPFENWLTVRFLPVGFNNAILRLYRVFLTVIGYKLQSNIDGVLTLGYTEYQKICLDIVAGKRTYIFNDENWGLGQELLEEFIISTADWDKNYERN